MELRPRYTDRLDTGTATDTTDCRAVLEKGDILFFPDGGFDIPATVRTALMGATQDARSFHKNIAYKPNIDPVSGLGDGAEYATIRGPQCANTLNARLAS